MISVASQSGFEGPIERLLRRSILLLARDSSTVQDYLDLAELADAIAHQGVATEVAAVVRNCGLLRQGFARESAAIGMPIGAIERAVAELKALMEGAGETAELEPTEPGDAIDACMVLVRLLQAPLEEAAERALKGLIAGWRDLAEAAPVDPRAHADADLGALLTAFATRELQSFLQRNYDLAFAPNGSARLLHRAAQLGGSGLGPFLTTVRNVIRCGHDILGLVALATEDETPSVISAWAIPLAAHLHEHQAVELADELADLGLLAALRGLLAAALRRRDRISLIRHLRDAALDLGDEVLAWSAQHALLRLEPLNTIEWRCLGDMLATGGDVEGAVAAFNHAARLAPDDTENKAHLAALRTGDFSTYAVTGGFGTPQPRQLIRFARRAA